MQCAQAYRRAGHTVVGVVSGSSANLEWAAGEGLPAIRMEGNWSAALDGLSFDYLFSVANLRMLPEAVLRRARKLAVNFHDALLPRYAGLNATCWALMAREAVHGITWHEMTAQADAGRIVRQVSFEVSPEETALSLNAKCYEAGLAAFTRIAEDLAQGELPLSPQHGERQYFGRHKRPAALGTLDFRQPAQDLVALVRALDFGQYANPLGRAKIVAGDQLLLVRTASLADVDSGAAPGTVLAVAGDTLRVAAQGGELLLGGLSDAQGRPGAAALSPGMVLGVPGAAACSRLADRLETIARGEQHWTLALQAASPVELPYPRRSGPPAAGESLRCPVDAPARGATTAAAFHAWLSALSGQEKVSLLYTDAALQERTEGLQAWLTPWVPLTATTAPAATTLAAAGAAETLLAQAHAAGPMTRDLPLRLGERQSPLPAVARIALALAPVEMPEGCELLLRTDAGGRLELVADPAVFTTETTLAMAAQLGAWLQAFALSECAVREVPMLPASERQALAQLNATDTAFDAEACVQQAIAAQAQRTPDQVAVTIGSESLSYRELEQRSDALAHRLVARGVQPGAVVGLCLPRTPALLVAVLGIWKAGAAYLPLDPEYPRERLQLMVEDSQAPVVLVSAATAGAIDVDAGKLLRIEEAAGDVPGAGQPLPAPQSRRPAYVIYTSGSTGKPKGVVVTHRNVMNFFAGMDQRVPRGEGARWLAVTSLSFDISVLELYWTLARGVTVVLHSDAAQAAAAGPEFSLFYFASDDSHSTQDSYRLLLEGARFADREGFTAVWTPERHFHAFGGLYPNPVVTSAAIAACTSRVQIRAGSCVLPLHHPVRVAEDWAFVDQLSNGRVGISFAAGWQPNDFVLQPQAFARRQDEMYERMDVVRRLWRGEAVPFPGPNGNDVPTRTLPHPVQREIPVWITAAGNPKTFEQAGRLGCRLLTHLLGQKVEDVAEKLRIYRAAWQAAGHPGQGHVTLMLHTFVADSEDEAREVARGPMKKYLRSAMDLVKAAAWTFPTFVQRAAADGKSPVEIMESAPLSEEETDALLEHAFHRYYGTSALIGSRERCLELVDKVQAAGVDEIACLIDFGIPPDTVLAHLQHLKALMEATRAPRTSSRRASVAEQVLQHGVTHLQCTPSMAAMLLADAPGRAALSRLSAMMVGGEALPLEMATQLRALVPGELLNMYGPTETTVWSTTCNLAQLGSSVPLGQPIANTQLSIRTAWGTECPALVPGELFIGGDGVTDGYLHRPELNAERFVVDPDGKRWYRTGDLVRRLPDGTLDFLGRIDHQVKLRGHRIELGEIESVLLRQEGVKQAVVVARDDGAGQKLLAGYVTAKPGTTLQPAALREAVARALPEIMVPQAVLVLPALPMTPNGKVDRKALPDPRVAAAPRVATAPDNPMETTIAGIWQEVLGLPSVGTTENFFDLGGHSLLVVQVQRRLREATGQEVAITDMFRLPTIRALAAHLSGGAASTAVSQGQSRAQARRMLRTRHLQTATTASEAP
ncbi:MAG TPA: MupA/Atu3671 family FMN-dependent luciferase-like monooxygenase [Ramlibacter sp.]|uniref:MupA/Atu3671 family FMN-dependent luciferase-like monooxygenase n=1 Tax=Ramlibacter sp. TaxID=1917967 RepID=UPI002D65FA87|nr:MupA/Atu3671 family FMN-dependent luciferase-like monooxygenase [Ramlibacter sp.]HZY17563.1 MupA/Atu3671 family FMN-dependent luciferase-like monooxygenase [Ramlibacter sp.]